MKKLILVAMSVFVLQMGFCTILCAKEPVNYAEKYILLGKRLRKRVVYLDTRHINKYIFFEKRLRIRTV